MTDLPTHPTYCEIDLAAIRHNVRRMREIVGPSTAVMALVKANGYGHGAVAAAQAVTEAGAAWLAVGSAGEGLDLRHSGIAAPILVLGMTPPPLAEQALAHHLTLTVYDMDLAAAYAAAGRRLGRPARLHVKTDTGMGRLGLPAREAFAFTRALQGMAGAQVEGLFTHFATADSADQTFALQQLSLFQEIVGALEAAGARPRLVHAANSAAALALPPARLDLVRPGIALYGMSPSDDVPVPPDFRPALAWKSVIALVKTLPPGHSVGYGRAYVTQGEEQIATIPAGYGDGLRRGRPTEALVHGRRAPFVGRLCMDQAMLNVTGIPNVKIGDEVVLIGRQGAAAIRAEDVARAWGTICYEVTTGILARAPRVYLP
jgi:alanine racemase